MQSTTFQTIHCEVKEKTAFITLNRPNVLNAFNVEMIKELDEYLKCLRLDEKIRFIVVKGYGKAFSAGGDIKEMLQLNDEEDFYHIMDDINSLIMTFYSMPQLTIAAVEGPAAGLGLSLALGADRIICSTNSKLAMNFIGIGLVPDGGGHFLLKERIGIHHAKQIIWEGRTIGAEEGYEIGLIDQITDAVSESVSDYLEEWKKKPILAMIKTKKIYAELNREELLKTLELEKYAQWAMRQTLDHQEGIKSFIEKRKPVFRGE